MLELIDLSYAYPQGEEVLSKISFQAHDGELISLLGPNGVGKSTLFKCILGFYKDYRGEILYNGRNLKSLSRKELAREVAYIPQSAEPVYNYTVFDTVLMGTTSSINALQTPGAKQRADVEEALDLLNLTHLKNRGINQISGGERQLVLIARTMVQKARILIMDEPTANLDFGNQYMVLQRIRGLTRQGYTIIMSTHNPDHALRYSSHVLALRRNHTYAAGRVGEILTEELIRELYDIPVAIADMELKGKAVRSCIPLTEFSD